MKLTNLKKEFRRFVGLILAVVMLISSVPPVYAGEVATGAGSAVVLQENDEGLQSSPTPEEEPAVNGENKDIENNGDEESQGSIIPEDGAEDPGSETTSETNEDTSENNGDEESRGSIVQEDGAENPPSEITTEANEEILSDEPDVVPNPVQIYSMSLAGDYKDGTYEGTGQGRNGDIVVAVTIANNTITEIEVISQQETPSYWQKALALVDTIKDANSTDVDSVSSATLSSEGIKEAVNNALAKALKTVFESGDGSKDNPYEVKTAEQLTGFANEVNNGNDYQGKYIILSDDIDLSGQEWIPIGVTGPGFSGTFNGAGKTVQGLTIKNGTAQYAGLFGQLGTGARISDLELTNVDISTSVVEATYDSNVGSIAGSTAADVVINNCRIDGKVAASASNKISRAGGVVGFLGQENVVANCYTDVAVTAHSATSIANAGGIAGVSGNKCVIVNAAALGDVSARADGKSLSVAGGILGTHAGTAYNVYALGEVTSESADEAKHLAGGISGMVTPNTALINAYYNDQNAQGFMTATPTVAIGYEENVRALGQGDMSSPGFAEGLNNGLKKASLSAAAAAVAAANKPNMGDLQSAAGSVKFYAWEPAGGKVVLANRFFVDDTVNTAIFESGQGTAEDPFIIKTEQQLRDFAKSLSDDMTYAGIYIALAGDIDVSSEQWTPIGLGHYDFRGVFDGKGHAIKNMSIGSRNNSYEEPIGDANDAGKMTTFYGLFGVIGENGVVKNLGIENATVSVKREGICYAGLLAGVTDKSYIDSCYATGYVYSETTHPLKTESSERINAWAGGLIGMTVRGGIINSWTDAEVYCTAVGGLAESGAFIGMSNRSVVANCLALGDAGGRARRDNGYEGAPAVSSFIGVNGGKMANCYSVGNMKADSFSQYVGSITGWATGIARQFVSYYNSDAVQNNNGTINKPVLDVGFLVSAGVNDEGEPYDGTYHVGILPKSSAELKSQAFADLLNANHNAFPLDIVNGVSSNIGEQNAMGLPDFMKLKAWQLVGGIVLPVGEPVATTYKDMTPNFEPNKLDMADGTYYGRKEGPSGKDIYVEIKVEKSRIEDIRVTEHGEGAALEEVRTNVIQAVVASQNYAVEDNDSDIVKALKGAIATAAQKAAKRDQTGYGKVDPSIFAGGNGTETKPYLIKTADQLRAFAASVNADEHYEGQFIKLDSDISLAGMNWLPVGGSGAYGFRGTFDGNNKVIRHMTIGSAAAPEEYCKSVGLFANLEAAKIKNLGLENAAVYLKYMEDDQIAYAGLLAGYVAENAGDGGYIDFCYAKGKINTFTAKQNDSGGLVGGINRGTIANSYADVTIDARSRDNYSYAGGLVGLPNRAAVINNYAFGSINGAGNGARVTIGGIAGLNAGVAVNNFANVSLISENTTEDIGGFTGRTTGISYIEQGYYNTGAKQVSGKAVISPAKGVGRIVAGNDYGKGTVIALEGKALSELRSKDLADRLNANKNDSALMARANAVLDGFGSKIAPNVTLRDWAYSSKEQAVIFKDRIVSSPGSGGRGSSGRSSSDSNTDEKDTAAEDKKETNNGSAVSPAEAAAKLFPDVNNHWAATVIGKAVDRKLFAGVGPQSFAPDSTMTREMFVAVLRNLANAEIVEPVNFKDVEKNSWYAGSVGWANQTGIVSGISSEEFGVGKAVTREQIAVMLYNLAKAKGLQMSEEGNVGFADQASISDWARTAVTAMANEGIIRGRDNGSFDPQGQATRAEAAAMTVNFMERYGL
ncbi:S-layer homology domain-containing protein [Desulforamulus ruminis]|uniref:FMN-binding domain protein n=1 Tax=Desulforamulus ruminis (strain ATCC 23193 / DSM 2154 / NCIMB 8452 / DL) TaxID=696281 RepID=F6DUK9_DESRL|nr:S-layer homology domain-containing protein [Desulforamulus ruminis]AEG59076.1 FMN-binding domain protein [Desulforamulus ruminis DSM 2154]